MATEPDDRTEETLDPENWDEFRQLGHRMLDDMIDHLQHVRQGKVWQPAPDDVRRRFLEPLPQDGQAAEITYESFQSDILPYNMGNVHPRFWGWVMGNGTPLGMLADMLASGLNPNLGGGDTAPAAVETQVINWCKQMVDFPDGASGLLVSGGSMANLVGLAVARTAKAGYDVRQQGLLAGGAQLTFYGSSEMHSSLHKAVELMGMGSDSLRRIPVDDDYRIDLAALEAQIKADMDVGLKPIGLIGCAGTVNGGAVDPLEALADLAARYDLWYHVDGAFGALAYLDESAKPRLKGMERADSIAFDLHKWVYLPFEIGCVLVRDAEAHYRTFAANPDYLEHAAGGLAGAKLWYGDYGVQLTRGFRALKAWMAFKTYGTRKIGRMIGKNLQQARYLAKLVEAEPSLELLSPVDLNIVCFRFTAPGFEGDRLDQLNQTLLIRLQESGVAVPSSTVMRGKFALRCAITNHRTRFEDFDRLVEAVLEIGAQTAADLG